MQPDKVTDQKILTTDEVKTMIFPADPDSVVEIGDGVYEAAWSPFRTPFLDTEAIKHTPGAEIVQELCRHNGLYGFMVLRFKLAAVPAENESS